MEKYEEEQTLDENKDALDGENTEKKVGFFGRLKAGLAKTRNNIVHGIDNVFSGFSNIDEDFYEELEEILIMGDIGINANCRCGLVRSSPMLAVVTYVRSRDSCTSP